MIRRYEPLSVELTESNRVSSTAPVRSVTLFADGSQQHGVWEAEPGVHRDYQGQETVVVLQGRATVEGGSGAKVDVGPGDMVIVQPGEKTVWTVHEKIRKVFIVNQ